MSRRQFDACLPINRQRKFAEAQKIGKKTVRATGEIAHQFQGQKVRG